MKKFFLTTLATSLVVVAVLFSFQSFDSDITTSNNIDATEMTISLATAEAQSGCGGCWQNGVKSTGGFGTATHILCNCDTSNGRAGAACVCNDDGNAY